MSSFVHRRETIVPLIKFCTKIETCNASQIAQILTEMTYKFHQNNSVHTWIKILTYGFSKYYCKISNDLLYSIQSILSNSIKIKQTQTQHSSSLQIPSTLQLYVLSFLDNKSFNSLTISCRYFNILRIIGIIHVSTNSETKNHDISPVICLLTMYKKFKTLNINQLSKCIKKLPTLFDENASFNTFINILFSGFSKYHFDISSILFQQIISIFPKANSTQHEIISLLTIPKAIQIYCCTFLRIKDLTNLELSCRYMCTVARDPNSVISVEFIVDENTTTQLLHERFGKIQSLDYCCLKYENNLLQQFNLKWCKHVTNLIMGLSLPILQMNQTVISDYIHTFISKLQVFDKVKQCLLYENDKLLIYNKLRCSQLQVLELECIDNFGQETLKAINGCINLQRLRIQRVEVNNLNINDEINSIMSNPFNKLKCFETDFMFLQQLSNFVKWILNSSNNKKILHLTENNVSNVELFKFIGSKTLENLKQIVLKLDCMVQSQLLLKDISNAMQLIDERLDCIHIHSCCYHINHNITHSISEWDETLNQMANISSLCNRTNVLIDFRMKDPVDMNQFVSYLMNNKQFSKCKLTIKFYIRTTGRGISPKEDDSNNELLLKAKKFAMELVNGYNTYLKPFLTITKQIMGKIGISQIEITVANRFGFWRRIERCGFWNEHITEIQRTIEQQCDNTSVVAKLRNGFCITHAISCG